MKVYLAGYESYKDVFHIEKPKYVLESFYYIKEKSYSDLKPYCKSFLLDSGAYTFMRDKSKAVNWDEFAEKYIDFINLNSIDLFFELDIDSLVGIKEVERIRKKIEIGTNKQSIPVWHKSRGFDYWKKMVDKYDYVSLSASGNNGSSDWVRNEGAINILDKLNKVAQKNNCKVHALGCTQNKIISKVRFHSVDSTTWNRSKYGEIAFFNGEKMKTTKPNNTRMIKSKSKEAAQLSLREWIKFQKYAEINL